MDRRHLLKVIGAGGAAATAATVGGCGGSGTGERLIPYLIPVEDLQPGVSVEYATVCRECPAGCGMIVQARDGRAHKVEGNPEHPLNRGTLCLRGQTALQDLYHPDRIRQPLARDRFGRLVPVSWTEAERLFDSAVAGVGGGRAVWFGRLDTGPFDRLVDEWLGAMAPNSTRVRYEPFAYEALREAQARVFGSPGIPDLRIERANTLFCFGADFLETWVSNVQYARSFSEWRQARLREEHSGRYVFFGPRLSLTGANADQWVPIRPGTEALVARALTGMLGTGTAETSTGEVAALAQGAGVSAEVLERLAREFVAPSPSLAIPIGIADAGEAATVANEAVLRLNQAAGNVGRTYIPDWPHALGTTARHREVRELVEAMRAGEVGLLFLHDANPVYHLPTALRVAEAIGRVPTVVSFSSYLDETTSLASLVLPDHRPLESWGAYAPREGLLGLLQPAVLPVFDTRQTGDVLLAAATRRGRGLDAADFHAYLRERLGLEDEQAWKRALHRGGVFTAGGKAPTLDAGLRWQAVAGTSPEATGVRADERPAGTTPPVAGRPGGETSAGQAPAGTGAESTPLAAPSEGPLLLHLFPSLHFFDGRTANRPWAQEIPEPMAKAVWGSWVELHPETAARLEVSQDDLVLLTTEAGRLEVPALVTDRVRPDVAAVQIGQGHTAYTRYATGVGINPIRLLTGAVERPSGALIMSGLPVTVSRLSVQRRVVVLQTSEQLVEENVAHGLSLAAFRHESPGAVNKTEGGFAGREEERASLYRYVPNGAHHWGMAIDLDRCIGCNACVAACYAENNVPVVGREECARGRQMSWLRIENYGGNLSAAAGVTGAEGERPVTGGPSLAGAIAAATPRDLRIRFLPMLCQQCNNAPCEYVCPVYATMHSDEGLNQQVYNRCVGTRFCSNNCPYKVRRFNWFTYQFPFPLDQQLNPDVIHRPKGVMEKCTFCIQRIRRVRIDATSDGGEIRDGRIMTACQQTCPTDAIIFGDLRDPNSRVRQLADGPRGHGALSHLNTYPNITYLARVWAETDEEGR